MSLTCITNGNRRAPMATQEEDPPDNDEDNNTTRWKSRNGENNATVEDEGELLMDRGRPLSPGVSYIFLKNDLTNVGRLEDFDQEKIAAGFFSEVYKLKNQQTCKVMVLKKNVQQFNRPNVLHEIQLLNQVHHPNIIKFLGVCLADGQLHALTEYVNHGSLRQLICDDNTMFPWPVRLGMAQDIADGMSYLHRLKIIHRDLTSLNCLIKKNGHELSAIVSDLGLATKLPENSEEQLSIVGSPFWIAPESLHGKLYNETADIFSYGIVLCEMIARITADPEELPRLANFGLDDEAFRAIVNNRYPSCPTAFLQLAISCCEMTPTARPAFKNIAIKIENIATEYNSNNNDRTNEGFPCPRKSRSQSNFQPPRLNFHNIIATATRHRSQPRKLVRSNSDTGPRPDFIIRTRSQVNPFDTPDLQGGRVKLWDSSTDSTKPYSLELETLDDVSLLLMQGRDSAPIEEKRGRMQKRISQSLPSSPEMNRKIKQDEEISFVEELEDQEFEDTFLQDCPMDLTKTRRRSLLIREYSLPITWREDLQRKPRSRSSENFPNKRLDSGLSSFGDEEGEIIDGVSHLQLDDGKEVFEPLQPQQLKNLGKHCRSETR